MKVDKAEERDRLDREREQRQASRIVEGEDDDTDDGADLFVVLPLLAALLFAMDPIFGRPNPNCLVRPSDVLVLFLLGCQ